MSQLNSGSSMVRERRSSRRYVPRRRGAILVAAIVLLLIVTLVTAAIVRRTLLAQRQLRAHQRQLQVLFLVDAGEELALRRIAASPEYPGETWRARPAGATDSAAVTIRVESIPEAPSRRRLVVEAAFPEHSEFRAFLRRERTLPAPAPGDSS